MKSKIFRTREKNEPSFGKKGKYSESIRNVKLLS